jgi:hypothetical protein
MPLTGLRNAVSHQAFMRMAKRIMLAGPLTVGLLAGCSTMPPYVGDWGGQGSFNGAATSVVLAIGNEGKFRGFMVGPTEQWLVGTFEVASSNANRIVLKADVLTNLHSKYPTEDPDVSDASMVWLRGSNGESILVYRFKRQSGKIETFDLSNRK